MTLVVAAPLPVPHGAVPAADPIVADAVGAGTAAEAVSLPARVSFPVKARLPARIAGSGELFGRAKLRVVPVPRHVRGCEVKSSFPGPAPTRFPAQPHPHNH